MTIAAHRVSLTRCFRVKTTNSAVSKPGPKTKQHNDDSSDGTSRDGEGKDAQELLYQELSSSELLECIALDETSERSRIEDKYRGGFSKIIGKTIEGFEKFTADTLARTGALEREIPNPACAPKKESTDPKSNTPKGGRDC